MHWKKFVINQCGETEMGTVDHPRDLALRAMKRSEMAQDAFNRENEKISAIQWALRFSALEFAKAGVLSQFTENFVTKLRELVQKNKDESWESTIPTIVNAQYGKSLAW